MNLYPNTKSNNVTRPNGMTAEQALAVIANPNILINGDFQVWQRGTSFPTAKSGEITADRWRIFIDGGTAVNTLNIRESLGRMLITGSDKRYVIYQRLELTDQMKEKIKNCKTLSASAKYNANTDTTIETSVVLGGSGVAQKRIGGTSINIVYDAQQIRIVTYECEVDFDLSDYDYIQFNICGVSAEEAENGVYIYWGKLEYGTATPFFPRPYVEELVLCKRYFNVLNLHSHITLCGTTGDTFGVPIYNDIPMYRLPDVILENQTPVLNYRYNGQALTQNITSSSAKKYGKNESLSIELKIGTAVSAAKNTVGYIINGGNIFLDAEIY